MRITAPTYTLCATSPLCNLSFAEKERLQRYYNPTRVYNLIVSLHPIIQQAMVSVLYICIAPSSMAYESHATVDSQLG